MDDELSRAGAEPSAAGSTAAREEAATTVPVGLASRPGLDRDEQQIKDGVLRMGSLVEAQILAAIDSLVDHDAARAEVVIAGDRRINEAQREVSSLILRTIATQQPVARDLRFLLALDHVVYELERIGDHAASVAKQVTRLVAEPQLKPYVDVPEMGRLGAELVRGILRALVTIDDRIAREVAARDDEIDHLYHRIFGEVVELMRKDPANVERGTRILLAAHYLERIGDRVTNIAEDVVYLASGEVEDLNP
ncbi:MAG TPA: phosphate signaling complex protein PhoU [Candidatus Limnocylindrales bacterium]|nr:phosphate signaling complex protein PhoU [Candidatus Limnocylindrales bacterium]